MYRVVNAPGLYLTKVQYSTEIKQCHTLQNFINIIHTKFVYKQSWHGSISNGHDIDHLLNYLSGVITNLLFVPKPKGFLNPDARPSQPLQQFQRHLHEEDSEGKRVTLSLRLQNRKVGFTSDLVKFILENS